MTTDLHEREDTICEAVVVAKRTWNQVAGVEPETMRDPDLHLGDHVIAHGSPEGMPDDVLIITDTGHALVIAADALAYVRAPGVTEPTLREALYSEADRQHTGAFEHVDAYVRALRLVQRLQDITYTCTRCALPKPPGAYRRKRGARDTMCAECRDVMNPRR